MSILVDAWEAPYKWPEIIYESSHRKESTFTILTGLSKTSSNTDTGVNSGNLSNEVIVDIIGHLSNTVFERPAVLQ